MSDIRSLSFAKKQINKQNSLNLLSANNSVDTLVFEDMLEYTNVNYAESENIYLTPDSNNIMIHEDFSSGTVITNSITSISNNGLMSNITCKIFATVPYGSDIRCYIVDSENKEYPIPLNISDIFSFVNVNNLLEFKFKIVITKNAKGISPEINSFSIFYNDSNVLPKGEW